MSSSYHHGDVRAEALSAAWSLLSAGSNPSFRDVAAKVGVSHPTLLHHFKTKASLNSELVVMGFHALDRQIGDATQGADCPRDTFLAAGMAYVSFAFESPVRFRMMFNREQLDDVDFPRIVDAANASLAHAKGALEEGLVAGSDAEQFALLAWSTIHGIVTLWLDGPLAVRNPDPSVIAALAEQMTALLPWQSDPAAS